MQQTAFTGKQEKVIAFPQFVPSTTIPEISLNHLHNWQAKEDVHHKVVFSAYNNWEFFMSELEYE